MPAKNISVNCLILCDLCTFLLRSSCMQVCWSMVWKNQIDVLAGCRPSEFFSDQGVTDLQLAPKKIVQYHTKQFLVPSIIMSSCYCPFWHIFFFPNNICNMILQILFLKIIYMYVRKDIIANAWPRFIIYNSIAAITET